MFARRPTGTAVADRSTPSRDLDSFDHAPPESLAGRYVIERELGSGASSTVYLARDTKYDRLVAVKVLNRELAFAVGPRRFLQEIEITARLQHPNILAIHDSGESDGWLFYVAPYLDGQSLRTRLSQARQLPVDEALRITAELAEALHHAHANAIVHRDIKPENVLFSGGHACLADFGIAQAIQRAGGDRLTGTGLVLGTPAYMSPEQAAGDRELDGRSDLYSLACVLYEMLAGIAPFVGPTPESVVAQRFSHAPRPVRAFRAGVPPHVDRAITRALSLAPADRFPDIRSFSTALTAPTPEQLAEPAATTAMAPRRVSRWIFAVPIAAVALGIGVARTIGLGNPPMNSTLVAVLPFAGAGGRHLSPGEAGRDLYDAFRRWRDLELVDAGTVQQFAQRPLTDPDALALGRELGAGKLVQAVATLVGDSVRIDVALFEVASRRRTKSHSVMVPDVKTVSLDAYRRVAIALLGEREPAAGMDVGDAGTNLLSAWHAYQRGLTALRRWDLEGAERELQAAAAADAGFAQAQLWLAQIGAWRRDNQPESWSEAASRAIAGSAGFLERDRLLAQGVFALSTRRYAAACAAYDRLLAMDSLDAVAWFGRSECLTKDPAIVRDPRSPSGWRFVTSAQAGIDAFLRALDVAPDAQPVFSVDRRKRVLYASLNRYRRGFLTPRDSFAAAPSFDEVGDSLSFVPVPFATFARGDVAAMPATLDLAVRRQRDVLLGLARGWVQRSPRLSEAHEALAYALEVRGEVESSERGAESAVEALREARSLTIDSTRRFRLALAEARVLLKRGEFQNVQVLADSLLRNADSTPRTAARLVGLAALTGRATLTARLLSKSASSGIASLNDAVVSPRVPAQVRGPAARLLAHSALGICDSVRVQIPLVERAIDTYVEPNGRQRLWNEILPTAMSMAAPCDSARGLLRATARADRLVLMQQALARGDVKAVRGHFATLQRTRGADRPGDVAIDYTYHEAWLLAAIGDSAAAIERLDRVLDALPTLGDYVVEFMPQAAAVGRAMALRSALARRADTSTPRTPDARLQALWSQADDGLRKLADR